MPKLWRLLPIVYNNCSRPRQVLSLLLLLLKQHAVMSLMLKQLLLLLSFLLEALVVKARVGVVIDVVAQTRVVRCCPRNSFIVTVKSISCWSMNCYHLCCGSSKCCWCCCGSLWKQKMSKLNKRCCCCPYWKHKLLKHELLPLILLLKHLLLLSFVLEA